MGRFSFNEADNYGGSGGSSFFSLKDDGEVARVRFMYNSMEDVTGLAVHEVTVDDKRRYVNCIRNYNEPKSKCPMCAAGNMQKAKLYIPIYDIDAGEAKVWERGKNYFPKISGLCSRYSSADKPLVSHVFELERHGKKGDTQTTYEIFPVSEDTTTLDDLPEAPDVMGGIVLDKTAEEMQFYLDEGYFPNNDTAARQSRKQEEQPVRRTPSRRGEGF